MYAASLLKDCSRAELLEVTKIGKTEFDGAITELQTLFLVDAPKIIEKEPRFSVVESTALAVRESADDLVADHSGLSRAVRDFTKKVALSSGAGAKKKVGLVVNQTIALMGAGQLDSAIETVDAALKVMPENPDLLMLKGRCLRETNPSEAAKALNAAFKQGQRKSLLFDMWYQALSVQGHFAPALDVANLAIDNGQDRLTWFPLRARVLAEIGIIRHRDGNLETAIEVLQKAAVDFGEAAIISRSSAKQASTYSSDFFSINDITWMIASKENDLNANLIAFDVVKKALELGDRRVENVERLLTATSKLIAGLDLSSNSIPARAGRTRVSNALSILRSVRKHPELSSESYSVYDKAIKSLEQL